MFGKLSSSLVFIALFIAPLDTLPQDDKSIGYLKIKVNLESVQVFLDGEYLGVLNANEPLIKEVRAGLHKVTATKTAYKTQTKEVILQAGQVKEVIFEIVKPARWEIEKNVESELVKAEYGGLTVAVKRNGELVPAKVFLDDVFADIAPLTINKALVGKHSVRAEYESLSRSQEALVTRNEISLVEIELLARSKGSEAANTGSGADNLVLEMVTTDSIWFSIVIDGKEAEEYLFPPLRQKIFTAKNEFSITMGNGGGARFKLNGKELGVLGKRGAVVRNLVINKSNL